MTVTRDICSLRPNRANEVVHHGRFVIRDFEKEGRDNLPDSCEVRVGWLSGDWLKFIEVMGEFFHDLLGRHCGSKMVCPSSLGSGACWKTYRTDSQTDGY